VFPLTFVLSMLSAFICVAAAPNAFATLGDPTRQVFMPSVAGFVISCITSIMLVLLALLATRQLLYQLMEGEIVPLQIVGLYLASILLYGQLYLTCAFMDPQSFFFEQDAGSTNVISVWVAFQYFSVSTITCVARQRARAARLRH
jgi:hypothetical protein